MLNLVPPDKTPSTVKPKSDAGASKDDVLERLARLDDAPLVAVDAIAIPTIVEADPSVPLMRTSSLPVLDVAALATVPYATVDSEVAAAPTVAQPTSRRVVAKPTVVRRRRPRVRRVTRVVRHVDTWSVFKVALVFNAILYLVCLTAGVLLWNVAYATGTIDNIEKFFEQFGWQSFEFKGGELFHNGWIAGLFLAIGLTGLAVLVATIFNLITDLVGGIRVSVLEEEVVERSPARPAETTA